MRINAVIQARTGSSRLPGKVLRDLGGRPVLDRVVTAARTAPGVDEVVVATSTATGDDAVADRAAELGVRVVRGSEDDVLDRFVRAADEHPCDAVVRLTADCPLLDPELIGLVAATWRNAPEHDYVASTLVRTLPRGLDVELATVAALRDLATTATGHDRIHVTSGLYADPERFRCLGIVVAPAANDLRVTLDTADDLQALQGLVELLGDRTDWRSVVSVLRSHPELVALNAHVRQKSLAEG
ncbi:acylneuraminate cytidylyltransferase [Pseudonocardia sp. Ae168_Ps1]|uniref:cytidylyltransferase domain-containing protein n=1 Tax=unclassified Pseudonocardia TaxID=2619320 RepID=UPI0001FFE55D|nr:MULTISPECIES: glycosyltransferase family protein [unclassified Pseudonocardia]OLL75199.1 acylneuraminate cytidylyltransferase [Pseudonocardia sp. Ae150A_Ps1]OLL81193.1 acylneuraminate cytidylyltransferase [Pseudonocardia sp. Ae168_Ps1]OLL84692.1 acylneuraminate cytidylyltransferase [Pseudonocardia sp. Ae263_Ps1]OLL95291.1 acylneuraminate cytidylyltransferase [Pseudonocardia sp. Ae356_Ps1]OLM15828.1 acylneuraminate cytidylyltransferase [Pseudonocardia sp. Ae707_Ps1]